MKTKNREKTKEQTRKQIQTDRRSNQEKCM